MLLNIEVDVNRWSTGGYDPDDRWSRDSTDGEIRNVYCIGGESGGNSYWQEAFNLDVDFGDEVFAVVVEYDTGDTFGNDGCQTEVMDVFAFEEEAIALRNFLNSVPKSHDKTYEFYEYFNGKKYHIPWRGYFESLTYIHIFPLTVRRERYS